MLNGSRLYTRIAIAVSVALVAVGIALVSAEQARLRDAYLSERSTHLEKSLQAEELRLSQSIDTLRRDVVFLSNTPPIFGIMRATLNRGIDPRDGNTRAKWEARLQEIFSAFSKAHPVYYRIRYIGVADGGREIVSFDSRDARVANRNMTYGSREYFKRTLGLRKDQVYLSEFEFQQEPDGSDNGRVQTLRAATPVYTSGGQIFGMVVLSLDVRPLLESARQGLSADVQTYIANSAGQYLLHPEAGRSFVFGTPDRDKITADFPLLDRMPQFSGDDASKHAMLNAANGQLLSVARLHFDPDSPGRFLWLLYRIPDVMGAQQRLMLPVAQLATGLGLMLLLGIVALMLLRRAFAPLEQLKLAADQIAAGNHDIKLPENASGEIGALTRALNVMLRELSQREADILSINAELEQRVEQRTSDLALSNELLQSAVNESKALLQSAQLQSRRNQVLMATSMDGIHVMDMQGNVVEANEAFCRMLGYSREEVAGLNVADWDVQWSTEELHERFEFLVGKSELFETVHKRKDGSLIDVEITTSGVELDGASFLFASSRDITARKQAEIVMKQHDMVISAAIDGYWMTDLQGYLLEVNQAYADLSGYAIDELVGMHISQLEAIEQSPEEVQAHIAKVLAQGYDRFETQHRRKDGRSIDIEVSTTYLAEAERLFVFCRDISQRKRDEQTLRIAAVAFDAQEAIVITDSHANIVRVNRAFEEITGYCAADVIGKNPRIMSSGRHDWRFYRDMWQCLTENGSWAGEVWDRRKNGQIYPRWMTITAVRNESQIVTHYVGVFTDITERKRAEEEIRNLAFYDALTGLPNRRLLLERLRAALFVSARHRNYGALLFLDMDRFKILNDTLGHDFGDMMLIEVANRIKACVREMDTVVRLGGDEFVVLIEDVSTDAVDAAIKVGTVAEKIREVLARPYLLGEHEHHSSPSIGVSLYHGNAESVNDLLQRADMAMYQVKKGGRNGVCIFDAAMQVNAETNDALAKDLSRAIEQGELQLYFQIQVDEAQRPIGAEALLRWNQPQRGLMLPDQFLPIAEKSLLILDIDRWVLNEACAQLARWGADERMRTLTLGVNISARLFAHPDFVDYLAVMLGTYRIRPELLILESTECMLLSDFQEAAQKMRTLKALGVSLSMDDFGSGYSSLTYLKQLPLDQVKVCKSFVQGVTLNDNDPLLVQAIIELGSKFGLSVLAEGVETEAQFAFLRQHDCRLYQGFLFGKAVPVNEFEALFNP
ncbi:MAG TPA: EAL domain-containing protein [Gallionella sp.]|nr:EAL domain-containing protein [Gallionella sp.]